MSCTLKILPNLILKRNTEWVYYINRTQVTTNDPLKLEWKVFGGAFFAPTHCRELLGMLFCSCTLHGGFGSSFYLPAHCRELSGMLFLLLHIAGKFRGFFLCSCTLQKSFGDAFFVPAHCMEVSGVLFLFLHTAWRFRGCFLLNLLHLTWVRLKMGARQIYYF